MCESVVPGVELRTALDEWQDRRFSGENSPSRLTTGFLDGNNPIVDIYELKVRASKNQRASSLLAPCNVMQPIDRAIVVTICSG